MDLFSFFYSSLYLPYSPLDFFLTFIFPLFRSALHENRYDAGKSSAMLENIYIADKGWSLLRRSGWSPYQSYLQIPQTQEGR